MTTWIEPPPTLVPPDLQAAAGGHPLVAQTLARRGLTSPAAARAFLDPRQWMPVSPFELPGMDAAVARLEEALHRGEGICVWGDFDVDGQTATALLVATLAELGGKVSYHIPVRARESHGVSLAVLPDVLAQGASLLLTCDTGIAAHEALEWAQNQGVDVIVTDHHELPERLPQVLAIVNPRLLAAGGAGHALGGLPGVGVAYKLAEALYGRYDRPEAAEAHLDLAALGIVADVAQQTGETRYLLQRGLEALRHPRRPGLQVMCELAELDPAHLTEEHIGFVLGPRLNALGRLGDANPTVELLTTGDRGRARILALQLEGLNGKRKLLTKAVFDGALAQIEADRSLLDEEALVLAHPAWPAGIIGIVAGRLVERFHRPVVMIATPEGELGRGSARSVAGLDITAAIAAADAAANTNTAADAEASLLERFGGHPMAAGLAIDAAKIPEFRRRLSHALHEQGGRPEPVLAIDGYLSLSELNLDLVADLERLAPFGAGNPQLVLASRGLRLKSHASLGRDEEHLLLTVEDEAGALRRVVWWQGAGWPLPEGKFDLAYSVRASTFRGQRDVQVQWIDFRLVEAEQPAAVSSRVKPTLVDLRGEVHPLGALRKLPDLGGMQIWAEGDAPARLGEQGLTACPRDRLAPAPALVVWTSPPGPGELCAALEHTGAQTVYLCAVDPGLDRMETFMPRLAGLARYALAHYGGQIRLGSLAAATAHREVTVRKGLAWLAASGHLSLTEEAGGELRLGPGGPADPQAAARQAAQIQALLAETAAYRAYYARAPLDTVVPEK